MTPNSTIFTSKSIVSNSPAIHTANGSSLPISHVGHVSVSNFSLLNTFLIPKFTLNLLSVGQLCELGLNVIFTSSGCSVQDPKTRQTLGIGRKVGHLFELVNLHISYHLSHTHQFFVSTSKVSSANLWHSRLGLLSLSRLQSLISSGQLGTITNEHVDCLSCRLAKQIALPFNNS